MDRKGVPSVTDSLEQSAKQLGEGIRSIPRIQLGSQPNQQVQQPVQQPVQPQPQTPQVTPQTPPPKKGSGDDIVEKMRRWLLIGLTILIGGLAVVLIIWRIVLRFIG